MSGASPFLPVNLIGKRVVVTAGANGIGKSIAEGYQSSGASVFVCDIDEAAVSNTLLENANMHGCVTDVSNVDAVNTMFDQVERELGGVDILVNNAGIAGPTAGITEIPSDELHATFATDLESMFHCARCSVPFMRSAGEGCIINLSSVAGRLSFALRTPYSAAKWGVIGFTKSLALELGPEKIRVNAIQPGHVNTERFRRVTATKAEAVGSTQKEIEADFLSVVAMRETVETTDIANTALFLSSEYGAAITGQAISVCKGVEMMR